MRGLKPLAWLVSGLVIGAMLYLAALSGLGAGHADRAFALAAAGWVAASAGYAIFLWSMVLDCLRRPFPEGPLARPMYLALLVLAGPVGALVYLAARQTRRAAEER